MMKVGGGLSPEADAPASTRRYPLDVGRRRGLTFLEARPEVDPKKLGVFGVSVGGTLYLEHRRPGRLRVKAAAPVYGCGWEFYQYPPDLEAPVGDETEQLARTLIAPEAAANVEVPDPAAQRYGRAATRRMDLAYRTLELVPASVKGRVFTRTSTTTT